MYFSCLLFHLFSSDFSFSSFFLCYCWWVLKRFFRCSQTFRSSKGKEIWKRGPQDRCMIVGARVKWDQGVGPDGAVGWGLCWGPWCGHCPEAPCSSSSYAHFSRNPGSAGCHLGGREGVINKGGENVDILPKSAFKQQFSRSPHCIVRWEGKL